MRYTLDIRHDSCGALLDYWEELRADNAVPSHEQVHPRALKEHLPQVFMLDISNAAEPVYSLAGTRLCQQFGRELRGMPFFRTWEETSISVANAMLRTAQEQLVPISFEILASFGGLRLVDVEIVLAPLSFANTGVVRFIGAMHIANQEPLLYSGPVLSQRLVATQIAQHAPLCTPDGVVHADRAYPTAGGLMSLRASNDIFPADHLDHQASVSIGSDGAV